MTLSLNTQVGDMLESVHREGFTWVTGFRVGDARHNGPFIGPIINQSEKSMVTVTEGPSCSDALAGYAINVKETLVSFFNRTLMFRRPRRTRYLPTTRSIQYV
ncbi:hypothetical protein VTK56DRAFT_5225 [Thermocarpiscus australiensis]